MKKTVAILLILIVLLSLGFQSIAMAHSGRTDSNGGHYNRKTGEYHYHNSGSSSSDSSPSYDYTPDPTKPPFDPARMKRGDSDQKVADLQKRLIELGYLLGKADGSFGAKTEEAVSKFQESSSIDSTGIADTKTQDALFSSNAKSIKAGKLLTTHFIDVGQADAIFLELPNGQTMLIDAGDKDSPVASYIETLGYKKIDYLIATHPHADHIGGMAEVIKTFDIGNVYMPDALHNTATFEELLDAIDNKGLNITPATAGTEIYSDQDIDIAILSPSKNYKSSNLNNYSAVIKVVYGDDTLLFMGDAEKDIENNLISEHVELDADVLQVGHHGSDTSSSTEFLKEVDPDIAVVSVGKDNIYGHPSKKVLDLLKALGAQVFLTSEMGDVVITSDGKENTVRTNKAVIGDEKVDSGAIIIPKETASNEDVQESTSSSGEYVGSRNSDKYHYPSCTWAKKIKASNEVWFSSTADAEAKGYIACKVCKP